ncbi:MAG: hypothetical protein BJ554DRAFT_1954, partial [Olpidium bornovanus]
PLLRRRQPKFLTKEERAKLALERREKEAEELRARQAEERIAREEFELKAKESRTYVHNRDRDRDRDRVRDRDRAYRDDGNGRDWRDTRDNRDATREDVKKNVDDSSLAQKELQSIRVNAKTFYIFFLTRHRLSADLFWPIQTHFPYLSFPIPLGTIH